MKGGRKFLLKGKKRRTIRGRGREKEVLARVSRGGVGSRTGGECIRLLGNNRQSITKKNQGEKNYYQKMERVQCAPI